QWNDSLQVLSAMLRRPPAAPAGEAALFGTVRTILTPNLRDEQGEKLDVSGFQVFSQSFVFSVFLAFLLPLWGLSFSTQAVGGQREGQIFIWVLSRPLTRPAIYLAKFVALLPWGLGLNVGGFAILCLAAGTPGRMAFRAYWPAVVCASLTFISLFMLFGAYF